MKLSVGGALAGAKMEKNIANISRLQSMDMMVLARKPFSGGVIGLLFLYFAI